MGLVIRRRKEARDQKRATAVQNAEVFVASADSTEEDIPLDTYSEQFEVCSELSHFELEGEAAHPQHAMVSLDAILQSTSLHSMTRKPIPFHAIDMDCDGREVFGSEIVV